MTYKYRFPNTNNTVIFDGNFSAKFYITNNYVYVESNEKSIISVAKKYNWESLTSTDFNRTVITLKPDLYTFWVHITATGGDGKTPIGIINDGKSYFDAYVSVRTSKDPTSDIIPLSGEFRITIREIEGLVIYNVVTIALANGEGVFRYTTSYKPAICKIDDADFDSITINNTKYNVKLVNNPFIFKIHRGKL